MRILHRILATMKHLKLYNIITDDTCTFCGNYIETIQHMYVYCVIIKQFWEIIVRTFNMSQVTPMIIILGNSQDSRDKRQQNLITLLGKHYIWCCAKSEIRPTIKSFCEFVQGNYKIQKGVATITERREEFDELWVPIFRALPSNRNAV